MRYPLATAAAAALMTLTAHAFAEGTKPEGANTGAMHSDSMKAGAPHGGAMKSGDDKMKSEDGSAMKKQPESKDSMGKH